MAQSLLSANLIRQRINRDVAAYLSQTKEIDIRTLVAIAATPAIHTDFSSLDADKNKPTAIIRRMQVFVKRHKRFLDLTKEATTKGLLEEWVPNLDDVDIFTLLKDIYVVGTTDDGDIIPDMDRCEKFLSLNFEDVAYGTSQYFKLNSTGRGGSSKIKLTSIEPDRQLGEKLAKYIEWYKSRWDEISAREGYKWRATEYFGSHFDISAHDLSANLKDALRYESNLLSGHMNFAKSMLLKIADSEETREGVRAAFISLFDESKNLAERADGFIEQFDDFLRTNKELHPDTFRQKEQHKQDPHAISVYLAFKYPSKCYIFKQSVWVDFCNETGVLFPSLNSFTHKLVGYEMACDLIRKVLIQDKELTTLNDEAYEGDISDYHLLTQDFIYAVGRHLQTFGW